MRRIVSCIMLSLFLAGTLTLVFNVGLVRAQGETVYINSDGSVSPSSAPISSVDNVTYTFTGNMSYPTYNGIVVERNNTVIDGNGYTMQGNLSGVQTQKTLGSYVNSVGINLMGASNVTIENANVGHFMIGIYVINSNNNVIRSNDAMVNYYGIFLNSSSSNIVGENNATANAWGIYFSYSSNNTVIGNNATANTSGICMAFSSSNNTDQLPVLHVRPLNRTGYDNARIS